MKNFELFHQNFIKNIAEILYERSYISKFWNSQNIHLEIQWFSWKVGPFQNWHDIWSGNSDFLCQKIYRVRNSDPYSKRLITNNRWFFNSEG